MPAFTFPPQMPSLFFEPKRYRPHGIGYWSGHIPFACDLIHQMRPRVLVELGTHQGESYFAFCQAIAESGATTRAFAVDTWRGDRHTGAYSDRVFTEVEACNRPYASFSTLVRATFDEAVSQFNAESIDLLHIDGSHLYEEVRHDFETWWPKVKPGGVVLLHDSFERGHQFGVWRLVAELGQPYAVNEFTHSHGLAVICKPPLDYASLASAFATGGEAAVRLMRRYYETRAASLHERFLAQRKPSDWDITSQVFWRRVDREFEEEESMRAAESIGATPASIVLPVPASAETYRQLRVAPTLVRALMALHEVAISDSRGETIWRQTAAGDGVCWQAAGLRCAVDREGALLTDTPDGSLFDLDLPDSILARLSSGGGVLTLVVSGLDPFTFVSALAAQQGHETPKRRGHTPGQ